MYAVAFWEWRGLIDAIHIRGFTGRGSAVLTVAVQMSSGYLGAL